jgi:hypothetical protein
MADSSPRSASEDKQHNTTAQRKDARTRVRRNAQKSMCVSVAVADSSSFCLRLQWLVRWLIAHRPMLQPLPSQIPSASPSWQADRPPGCLPRAARPPPQSPSAARPARPPAAPLRRHARAQPASLRRPPSCDRFVPSRPRRAASAPPRPARCNRASPARSQSRGRTCGTRGDEASVNSQRQTSTRRTARPPG